MKNLIVKVALIASLLATSTSFANLRADLTAGTMSASGDVLGHYDVAYKEKLSKMEHRFSIGSSLGLGYFIADNLLLEGRLPIIYRRANQSNYLQFGVSVGVDYFFDIGNTLYPYLGLSITPAYMTHVKKFILETGPKFGMLVSLSESVALDFGIRSDLGIKLSATDQWSVKVAAGFIGVRAFF
jgi:hypothetical protein